MPLESSGQDGGISRDEFLLIQQQLLDLRQKNYELQEELRRKNNDLVQTQQNSHRNEALQFASKLIHRASTSKKDESEIDNLRRKLATQEEEFKLQQSTLFEEMNRLSSENEELRNRLESLTESPDKFISENDELKEKLVKTEEKLIQVEAELKTMRERAEASEKLTTGLEDMMLDYQKKSEEAQTLLESAIKQASTSEEELRKTKAKLDEKQDVLIAKVANESKEGETNKIELERQILLLETRYQLEIDDLKKEFESEKEKLVQSVNLLEEKIKSHEVEKKLALKKQAAVMKELQKSLKEEKKRADSYEKKNEEKSGWHVVQESDGNSSHTFDGNESISSLSAVESENVELINRLATLQRIHSENADRILQLESENSRLRRENLEKGELIEHWIKEKPIANSTQTSSPRPTDTTGFRRLLNTLGPDQASQDLKEMNKKLQRLLEETLSKNIILQRDIQTLLERTES
ncbi:unnamed protein product [Caenorhabditis bovis]|uniref:GRIP1-associated protein 1 n=1 Tax=Caenorhabditis bovis TaxID=2654633 RepID=A0A8S1FDX0_9PELO|nr:unnamed protein product [Caenorhabditis bovis]